jgi:hypothetical protein
MAHERGPKGGPARGNRQRFPYEPRVVGGKLMMPAESQAIHRYVVETAVLENVTEEIRAVIETVWPELRSKLRGLDRTRAAVRREAEEDWGKTMKSKDRKRFSHRIDMWDDDGENVLEHLAGVEDFDLAMATYRAACLRWPGAAITIRQGARILEDSRKRRLA